MRKLSILVVEDEINLLNLLKRIILKKGYNVYTASNGNDALLHVGNSQIDIVLTDIRMPGLDGIDLLTRIKSLDPNIEVIVMTAFATVDTAIKALKKGARDYIRKPFNIEEVLDSIKKTELTIGEYEYNTEENKKANDILVANSPAMKDLVKMIQKVAGSVATIYIHGETGVGKELVARAIHESSNRKNMPFIKVNCSALPETLLESELFGYEKGAFTGAFARKLGRFELANGGTIFLDEIGDISQLIQLKLLRVLQEKELERLGGTETIPLDVRIITATNKNLDLLVSEGKFREDLYYRLNVIPLFVPPLRERPDDIGELISIFMKMTTDKHQARIKELNKDALHALLSYSWPGNVRELENIIERIIVISDGFEIALSDLPSNIISSETQIVSHNLSYQVENTEELLIRNALHVTSGNVTKAAEKLGISRRSLHRKINKFNI